MSHKIPLLRVMLAAGVTALGMLASPRAAESAEQDSLVLQLPIWGCPTVYQAASWATRESCVLLKPPATGRPVDAVRVQGNEYVKVVVGGGASTLWFSAVPNSGPWRTWRTLADGEDLRQAVGEAAAHAPWVPALPDPLPAEFSQHEIDLWKAEGINAHPTSIVFIAEKATWVCPRINDARKVRDAVERGRKPGEAEAEMAGRMLNDAVAHGDCWLMDRGTEGQEAAVTIDGEFRNVSLYRFPYGAPVITPPHASGITGWAATADQP